MPDQELGVDYEVVALDFDDVDKDKVVEEVRRLQDKYELADASLYKTSPNSYHVFFFANPGLSWGRIEMIINEANYVDDKFKQLVSQRESTRMRLGDDIEFIRDITSNHEGDDRYKKFFKRMHKIN